MSEYDGPWKEAIDLWLEAFLAFFFPAAHDAIDWNRGWESLDGELRQATGDAELGERRADKLVKVWRRGGEEAWLLIHLEVQSQHESDFARRMFVYHYRIFDRYNRQVVSLAVLGDDRPKWRPDRFGYDLWGCDLNFRFPIVKLLDFARLRAALATSPDPIAAMVLAHLSTLEKPGDEASQFVRKREVIRSLYDRGLSKERALQLLRLIDWMMTLPGALEPLFRHEHEQWELEKQMPYITSFERLAREEGREEGLRAGLLEGIELGLKLRFGEEGLQYVASIQTNTDIEVLRRIKQAIETATTLDDIRRLLN